MHIYIRAELPDPSCFGTKYEPEYSSPVSTIGAMQGDVKLG